MIAKTIKFLTILLLLLFPIGLVFRIKLASNILFVPQDMVVLLIFILTCYEIVIKGKLKFDIYFKIQLLFVIFGIGSLILNSFIHKDINIVASSLYAIRYIAYIGLINVGRYFSTSKLIKPIVILSGTVFIILGYLQYYFYNDLAGLKYLGWDIHLYRLFSTFLDPNFAGVFYVFFLFIIFYQQLGKKFRDSYLYVLLFVFDFLAIILTYSRTAIIALVVSSFFYCLLMRKIKIFFMFFISLLVCLILFSDISVEGLNPLRTASTNERIKSIENVSKIIQINPITGIGFNAFRDTQIRLGIRNTIGANVSNADAGTDNSYLFVLAVAGIPGFFLFIVSYFYLIKQIRKEREQINIILISSLIGIFVGSMFLNVLFYTPILAFILLTFALRKKIS